MANLKFLKIETVYSDIYPYDNLRNELIESKETIQIPSLFKKVGVYKVKGWCYVQLDDTTFQLASCRLFDMYLNNLNLNEHPLSTKEYIAIQNLSKNHSFLITKQMSTMCYNFLQNLNKRQLLKENMIMLRELN